MDGLEAVERIMASRPTPILLMTADPTRHSERGVFEAMTRGALDLVPKTILSSGPEGRAWLRERVRLLASVPVVYRPRPSRPAARRVTLVPAAKSGSGGIGLVASTGGPPVLGQILAALPREFPLAILLVQHLAPGFAGHLASWLASSSRLPVRIAVRGETIGPGIAYLAPDGAHLIAEAGGRLGVDPHTPPIDGHRPSGSRLLSSMARLWGASAVGVVLTGMGSDGVAGLDDIRRAGGVTIAQDQASSAVYGMPKAARDRGAAREVMPASDIAERLCRAAEAIQALAARGRVK
jgi:two-component system chemotaxis response regulator CheB